jgi:DHA1 family quinolone resistance protein-like MFS transporter
MNRTIKYLMLSDVFFSTGLGLVEPILAIYIKDDLAGGSIFSVGIASTIFLLTKSIIQLPIGKYVDKHNHKYLFLIIGSLLITVKPFLYIFTNHIYWVYFIQFIYGLGSALAFPSWLGLWSTHLDKNQESFEWSLYSTTTGIALAFSAAIGASVAQWLGFQATFLIVGSFSIIGCLTLLKMEYRKAREAKRIHRLEKERTFHQKVIKPGNGKADHVH